MDRDQQIRIVEALILAAPEPVSPAQLAGIVPHLKPKHVAAVVKELNAQYESGDHAFEIWEVAGGYQLRTRSDFAGWVKQLQKERPLRLSRPALETLSVIAYKQPVTRAEIEHVRGVDIGAVLRSLVERKLVRIAGHREVPGRPMVYATGKRFLEVFGLNKLDDLPTLREIESLAVSGLEEEEGAAADEVPEAEVPASDEEDALEVAAAQGAELEAPAGRRELH